MIRVGGWRARLLGMLGSAAIMAAALAPSFASAGSHVAGVPAHGAAFAGPRDAPSAPLPAACSPDAVAATGAATGASTASAPAPVHPAPVARPPIAETPVLDAAPALGEGTRRAGLTPRPVLAASDGLDIATSTTYVVDPIARVVRVAIDLTAVNRLPVTPGARYYYPGVNLAVQLEGRQFVADEGGTRDRTTTQARTGYRLLTVGFAARLYIGQTAHVHVAYVLPGGAPRSSSQVRVGAAFTTFVAWAFGDRGTVEVDVPQQFSVDTSGGAMQPGPGSDGQQVLTASASDPGSWYAWIDARNDSALTTKTLALPGNQQVVVRAWPEDATWQKDVSKTLTSAIPALAKRIGLPWPVSGQLSVLEVSGALLEGYAGFYSPGKQQITISEAVDPLTVVHEASHVWFNSSLFTQRWMTEGLADEYAYRTLRGLGITVAGPGKVRANALEAFALDTWGTPAPIKSRTQDAYEKWGYAASWTTVRAVVAKLGEPRMAAVFAAARAGTTAYRADGTPEKSALPADWRRFVDLAEEVGGGSAIAELIAPWVLTTSERGLLPLRATARTAYHDLLAADGDWAAPVVVRMDLDAWDFAAATRAIADATAVLAVRDAIRSAAAAEHLTLPTTLEPSYETATSLEALAQAADGARALRSSLEAVTTADAAVRAPRDWLVTLGLVGQDPSASLAAARAGWAAGDAPTAAAEAAAVQRTLSVAADAGRLRLVAIGAGLVALALVVILAVAMARRRSRAGRGSSSRDVTPNVPAGTSWAFDGQPASVAGEASTGGVPTDAAAGAAEGPIDPTLAPPSPPAWWRPAMPPDPSVGPGPYPILPANAAARPTPRSSADRHDEGAQ